MRPVYIMFVSVMLSAADGLNLGVNTVLHRCYMLQPVRPRAGLMLYRMTVPVHT